MSENTSIVYLYGFSTMLESKLENFLGIIEYQIKKKVQISVVFIHDGVIGTSKQNKPTQMMQKLLELHLTVYSMIPDLIARGINSNQLQSEIKGIDYQDLVDILVENSKIVSWM